jgi:hypothetical protein
MYVDSFEMPRAITVSHMGIEEDKQGSYDYSFNNEIPALKKAHTKGLIKDNARDRVGYLAQIGDLNSSKHNSLHNSAAPSARFPSARAPDPSLFQSTKK